MFALILAQVQNLEGPVVLACFLAFALHADEPFAGGVDGELAEIRDDPLPAQLLRHRRRGAGTAEEVGDDVVFVGGGFDDTFEQGFGLLGSIA